MKNLFLIAILIILIMPNIAAADYLSGTAQSWKALYGFENRVVERFDTKLLSAPLFSISSTSSENFLTYTAIKYSIDGILYSIAKLTNETITNVTPVSASTSNCFLISANAAGTLVATAGTANATLANIKLPDVPASTSCPLALVQVTVDADGAAFTLGTTGLDAASTEIIIVDLLGGYNQFKLNDF